MRRMVLAHQRALPHGAAAFPYDVAIMRATEAVSELADEGSPTIKDVAAYLGLEHSTTSRALTAAEHSGLVLRSHDEVDRRKVSLHLTPKGADLVREIPAMRQQFLDGAMTDWADDDVSELCALLERFRVTIDRAFASPHPDLP
jgi:DNA-binding MarR family transcriptional regulator